MSWPSRKIIAWTLSVSLRPIILIFPIAKAASEAGFNLICEKLVTFNFSQAKQLV